MQLQGRIEDHGDRLLQLEDRITQLATENDTSKQKVNPRLFFALHANRLQLEYRIRQQEDRITQLTIEHDTSMQKVNFLTSLRSKC